jgi:1-aminocyclopropane-1-carboxylate deaminase/D-cysteine desulfhydrase-like pyridoxal-dependent ACC family enzyme
MTKQKRTRISITAIVSLSLVIAAVTYGFAQANMTHSAGIMGAGYGVKSTFKVSNIQYVLDLEDTNTFTSVSFAIDQEISRIQAGVSATEQGAIAWAEECEQVGTRWTCSFEEDVELLAADWLHVISAQ